VHSRCGVGEGLGGRAGSGADRGGIGQDPVPRHERASASRGPATGRTRREGAYPLYPLIELKLGRLSTQSSAFGAFAPFEVLLPVGRTAGRSGGAVGSPMYSRMRLN
jgi:hypothetical protein